MKHKQMYILCRSQSWVKKRSFFCLSKSFKIAKLISLRQFSKMYAKLFRLFLPSYLRSDIWSNWSCILWVVILHHTGPTHIILVFKSKTYSSLDFVQAWSVFFWSYGKTVDIVDESATLRRGLARAWYVHLDLFFTSCYLK